MSWCKSVLTLVGIIGIVLILVEAMALGALGGWLIGRYDLIAQHDVVESSMVMIMVTVILGLSSRVGSHLTTAYDRLHEHGDMVGAIHAFAFIIVLAVVLWVSICHFAEEDDQFEEGTEETTEALECLKAECPTNNTQN